MCPTMRTCVRLQLRPLYCPAVPGHASLTVPYGSQGSLSFGRPAIWQLERHSIAELAQCRRSLVRLLSRRRRPAGPQTDADIVGICLQYAKRNFQRTRLLPAPGLGSAPPMPLCPAAESARSAAARRQACPGWHNLPAHRILSALGCVWRARLGHCGGHVVADP